MNRHRAFVKIEFAVPWSRKLGRAQAKPSNLSNLGDGFRACAPPRLHFFATSGSAARLNWPRQRRGIGPDALTRAGLSGTRVCRWGTNTSKLQEIEQFGPVLVAKGRVLRAVRNGSFPDNCALPATAFRIELGIVALLSFGESVRNALHLVVEFDAQIEGLNMKKLALALAATAAFAGQAIAADMPMKARPAPAPVVAVANWTGCYISGGIGYGMYDQENRDYFNPAPAPRVQLTQQYDTGGRGWLGRVGGGCDYQFGGMGSMNLVIGAFADYDWADINGRFASGGIVATETLKSQWAVGGRIGLLVTPQLLTYFSGGYTEANFGYGAFTTLALPVAPAGVYLNDHTYKGWFLGSGLEYQLNWLPGLTVKTEYRFSEFDVGTNQFYIVGTNVRNGFEIDSKKYVQTVTTSLSYKFNFGGGAVVAKY